jgi:hypothetical protein
MTKLATPILYVVKPPAETTSVCAYCQQSHGRFHSKMKFHTKHSVGSQISLVVLPRKLYVRTYIYQHGSIFKTVIMQATAHAQ